MPMFEVITERRAGAAAQLAVASASPYRPKFSQRTTRIRWRPAFI